MAPLPPSARAGKFWRGVWRVRKLLRANRCEVVRTRTAQAALAPHRNRFRHAARHAFFLPLCPKGTRSHENFIRSDQGSRGLTVVEIGGASVLRSAAPCYLDPHQAF